MRNVPLWIAKTDNESIPPRVKDRVLERHNHKCGACSRPIAPGEKLEFDHIVALINGGAHSEENLQPLCSWCHKAKTARDVKEKAKTYRMRAKHRGIKLRKGRGLSHPFLRRKLDGTVVKK